MTLVPLAFLSCQSPSRIYLGEDGIHMPMQPVDAVTKEKWAKYIE